MVLHNAQVLSEVEITTTPRRVQSAIRSHGWSKLPLFQVNPNRGEIVFCARLHGQKYRVHLQDAPTGVRATATSTEGEPLAASDLKAIATANLGLDVELSDFWSRCQRSEQHRWAARFRAGNFLRCGTVFEDLIVLICTTNCSWTRAVANVQGLCSMDQPNSELPCFPAPHVLSCSSIDELSSIGLGYRARYILAIAQAWEAGNGPTRHALQKAAPEKAREQLLKLLGVGPYVAETLLRISGVHCFYGLDSWNRPRVPVATNFGIAGLDQMYSQHFGRWRGLAFWLDATAHWYTEAG